MDLKKNGSILILGSDDFDYGHDATHEDKLCRGSNNCEKCPLYLEKPVGLPYRQTNCHAAVLFTKYIWDYEHEKYKKYRF